MKKISPKQKQLAAEFFANIAVAWFAAGVIGIFLGGYRNTEQLLISLSWGLSLSFLFLYVGLYLIKGQKL